MKTYRPRDIIEQGLLLTKPTNTISIYRYIQAGKLKAFKAGSEQRKQYIVTEEHIKEFNDKIINNV